MAQSVLPLRGLPRSALLIVGVAWLPLALVVAVVAALLFGAVSISPADILGIIGHRTGLWASHATWSASDEQIVWNIRLPRVLAAALVGGGLSLAGALFQAVLRNPLADPYVIGTSAGAQLGVTVALVAPFSISVLGFGSLQTFAFIGALATVLFVYFLARTGSSTPVVTLILAGFVTSSFLISAASFLMVTSSRMSEVMTWTMGGIEVTAWSQLAVTAPALLLTCIGALLLARPLDALSLGEEAATSLGIRVEWLKLGVLVLASLVTGLAVSMAGVVAFVGLIIPHAIRLVYGPGHRVLLPAATVGGAIFLVLVDLVCRTVAPPSELPLGVMTAVLGAPFFLHLLRRGRRDYAL